MDKNISDSIIHAHATKDMLKYFVGQVAVCAIVIGLKYQSWILFGVLLFAPIIFFLLSGRFTWCKWIALVLSIAYIFVWGFCGYIIGSIFSVSASIVLCLIFLIPGVSCNWAMIDSVRK